MSTDTSTANAYLRTKVLTAKPEELRLMLLDGAIKFARQGREGLAERDFERSYNGLTKSKDILIELINGLRPEVDPELCGRLNGLYTFMYRRLIDANLEKSPTIVDEVIRLLEYERETWVMLMQRLAAERKNGAPAPETPAPTAPAAPAAGQRAATTATSSVSFEG